MNKEPKIIVVLTPDARENFKDEPLHLFITRGTYFICESAEQNGSFIDMKLYSPPDETVAVSGAVSGKHIGHDVSIPIHYVLCMVSNKMYKRFGFKTS